MLARTKRVSPVVIVGLIFVPGCANLALSLLAPDAMITKWLGAHWRILGLGLTLIYLALYAVPKLASRITNATDLSDAFQSQEGEHHRRSDVVKEYGILGDKVLRDALTLPFPDAIFRIVEYNRRNSLRIELDELQSITLPEELYMWSEKAGMLLVAASNAVENARRGGDYDGIGVRLEATYPGFSQDTYKRAINYGIQETR